MADIILHHYARSPFSEKVRAVFGFKGLAWRGVEVPRMLPKPDLMPLTGGYRKTPVMQIGADIYCDTRLILEELERRTPKPTLYPAGTRGQANIVAAWFDQTFFGQAVGLVFGTNADQIPQEFKEDRRKMTAGSPLGFDADIMKKALPHTKAQVLSELPWIEASLGEERTFLLANAPTVADFAAYHCFWFLNLNLPGHDLFAPFPRIRQWIARMAEFGTGEGTPLDPKEALAIARTAPKSGRGKGGRKVTVSANDYGRDPVAGTLALLDEREIVIRREDEAVGEVILHFPRIGFTVSDA
ncbi:MAG TPA: glutathione S-transferase family protein [Stellaceae bacterium]|nr:glutathione S-transferase family protein [Stellaceae bacterium]